MNVDLIKLNVGLEKILQTRMESIQQHILFRYMQGTATADFKPLMIQGK